MPTFDRCLRILVLLPTRYETTYAQAPGEEIPPEKVVDVQRMLVGRYKGLSILQPYQAPFLEGWWQDAGGVDYPPEFHRLVDIVTRRLATRKDVTVEKQWLLDTLYPSLKEEFGQQEIFLLIHELERIFEP